MRHTLNFFLPLLVAILISSPAFAEVCDKMRPRWDPRSGSVNQLEELYFFFTSYIGIGLLGLTLVAIFLSLYGARL